MNNGKPISLTPGAWEYVKTLLDQGGDKDFVPVTQDVDPNLFSELTKKQIVERVGAKKGRGGSRGTVRVLIDTDAFGHITKSAPRAPRTPSNEPRAPRATRTSTRDTSTLFEIPKSAIPFDHAKVQAYLDATTGNAQREWQRTKQEGLTDVEVAKHIKGLRGQALLDKLHSLEDEHAETFKQHLVRLGFNDTFIAVLGIPEVGPDSPDVPVEVVPARSNGVVTPPKRLPSRPAAKAKAGAK